MEQALVDPWRALLALGLAPWLEQRSGLSAQRLDDDVARAAVHARLRATGLSVAAYWARLHQDEIEAQALLEGLLVRETRFYRDLAPFRQLSRWARRRRTPVRALSLPCSSGEEAISIAIALHQGGLPWEDMEVVGVDLSVQAVETARRGHYSRRALSALPPPLGELYFRCRGMSCRPLPELRARLHFWQGNLFRLPDLGEPFEVIFCRNLLLYCGEEAREQGLQILRDKLSPDGLLFLGHAEHGSWVERYFRPQRLGSVLAWTPRHRRFERLADEVPPPRKTPVQPLLSQSRPHHGAARRLQEAQRLYRQGRIRAAMETLRGVIYLYPTHWNALDLMARWAERAGEREYARRYRRWAERVRRRNEGRER